MYIIYRSKTFEKSFKKLKQAGLSEKTISRLMLAINMMAGGQPLDMTYSDHQLTGKFKNLRECHIQNDLLLVYELDKKTKLLTLSDIGSHSQIFR